jgi:hypothetical protein
MGPEDDKHCFSCGKTFIRKNDYERHKRRKTPCLIQKIPENDTELNRCKFCNKAYKHNYTLTRHYKTCVIKNGGMDILVNKVKREEEIEQAKIIQNMMSMMKTMEKKLDEQSKTINELLDKNHLSNYTQNNAPHNFNNTTINNYLTPNVQNLILDPKTIDNYSNLSYAVLDHIYFNPCRPENHSFYISNKKEKELMVYTNQGLLKPDLAWKLLTTDKDRGLFVKDLQNTIIKEGGNVVNNIYNNDLKQFEGLPKDLRDRIINFNSGEKIEQREVFQITLKGTPSVKDQKKVNLDI